MTTIFFFLAFAVPSDNPFYGDQTKQQTIWAYGMRNPWRSSFDRLTGTLYTGDVGQDVSEKEFFFN